MRPFGTRRKAYPSPSWDEGPAERGAFQTKVGTQNYPPDLETLVKREQVQGKKIRFLRKIPVDPSEFAGEVVRILVAPLTQGQRRKIVAVYLDPANFKNIGDGHTIADQINEVLEPYDLGVIAASNDRMGGWQLMYQMLQKGEWQIADTCKKLIEAIPSRMHDEKRPGDVLKVPGDPLDDVADDVRYGIYTFITTTQKPRELVIAEELRRLAQQGDLTSASIRYQQMIAETQVAARPIRLGRSRRC